MIIYFKNRLGLATYEKYKTPIQMSSGFFAGSFAAFTTNPFETLTVKK